jgi:type I restriction enzyme S subunit
MTATARQLPPDWQWVELGSLFEEERGQVHTGDADFDSLAFVGLENIESHTRRFISESPAKAESTCFRFDRRHVLYGKLRPYLDKVYVPNSPGKCCMEILPLKPVAGVSRAFLAAALQSKQVIGCAVKHSTGGRMPRADIRKLKRLCVPVPREEAARETLAAELEQKLSKVESMRQAAARQHDAASAISEAVYRRAFTFPDGGLPGGWCWKRLGEICDAVNGFGFPKHLQGRKALPYPFIKVSDMNAVETVITAAQNTVDGGLLKEMGARTYPKGTVVFPKVGGALLTNKKRILGVEACFDNNIMGLVPKASDLSTFIHCWVNSIDLADIANTQALPSIRQTDIAKMKIPFPEDDSRRRDVVDRMQRQVRAASRVHANADRVLEAVSSLPGAILRETFDFSEN